MVEWMLKVANNLVTALIVIIVAAGGENRRQIAKRIERMAWHDDYEYNDL